MASSAIYHADFNYFPLKAVATISSGMGVIITIISRLQLVETVHILAQLIKYNC